MEFHIAGADHSPNDSIFRRSIIEQAEQTIIDPEIIIKDNSRNIYLKLIVVPYQDDLIKIKPLKVVVDADRQPGEVVTWTPLNKMNGAFESEAIIYARNFGGIPCPTVRQSK